MGPTILIEAVAEPTLRVEGRRLNGQTLEADVCVVGAGPAALSLVREWIPGPLQVVVLESGDRADTPRLETLSRGHTIGDPYASLVHSRARRVGGTAHIWNTWLGSERAAKYVPLDPIDFEARPWVAPSGWPFTRAALEPYYARAHSVCGLGPFDDDPHAGADSDGGWIESDALTSRVYRLGPARLFTHDYPDQVEQAKNLRVCTGATAVGLDLDRSGETVTQVRAACLTGARFRVRARCVVLAAGGLENPRLLLLSNLDRGDRSSMVGRGFMDHPRDSSGTLIPSDPNRFREPGVYDVRFTPAGVVRGRLTLRPELMRRERLMNLSAILRRGAPMRPKRPWSLFSRRASGPGNAARDRVRVAVELHLEQAPHPENRVRLGRARDPFGLPRIELHWRWRDADRRSHDLARECLAAELERCGIGRLVIDPRVRLDPHAHHPMGATRMSRDPRLGVVDEHCRVHGVSNLFVAGSSVFPTSGYANPTLTIVALALRLADHLTSQLVTVHSRLREREEAFTRT